jgi:polar amino acid transport system substrate-binding protein
MGWCRLLCVCALFVFSLEAVSAASIEEIKKRGSIIVAVKSDYRPWGFTEENGNFAGMEIELAQDLARRLSIKLVLVPALSSNRIQLLNEGKVDLILATFSVTEERKKQVAFIEPSYYAAMTAILTKTGSGLGNEASLKGRTICSVAGNYSNKTVAGLVGRELIEAKTLPEAEEKLRAGECEGVNFDDVVLLYQLKSGGDKWSDYDIALLLSMAPAPWGIAIPLSEKTGSLAKFLSSAVRDWHRTGMLLALEKKWVGDNSMALQWLSARVKKADAATRAKAERTKGDRPKASRVDTPSAPSTNPLAR